MDEVKPCKKCGGTERYESGGCVACRRGRKDRPRTPEQHRARNLMTNYGITLEAWNTMLRSQNFQCAVCYTDFDFTRPIDVCTDHCHTTGLVRGILCRPCNLGLGFFEDSPARLEAAARYLELKGKTA